MNIVDIYQLINSNKKDKITNNNSCWKPVEAKGDIVIPPFTVPQKRKQKSTDKMLESALLFCDLVKHKRLCNKVTVMPISTNNKVYIQAFGYSKAISRLIKFMTEIGLISVANSNYRFDSKNPDNNKSREYYYFHDNECALRAYCETHNISVSHKSRNSASLFDTLGIGGFLADKVRFNSKLRLKKPLNYSKSEFEDFLRISLYANYPGFK